MAGTRSGRFPTGSVARASAKLRGKRTGVIIGSKKTSNELEDLDDVFDSAVTPAKKEIHGDSTEDEESPKVVDSDKERKIKIKKKKTPQKEVRMSLPGADDDENHKNNVVSGQLISKLAAGKKVSFSPSALSDVSTAPPTPREDFDLEEEANLQDTPQGEKIERQDGIQESTPASNGMHTNHEEEELVVAQSASSSSAQKPENFESPDAFPTANDEDGDDLLPPNPPEITTDASAGQQDDDHDEHEGLNETFFPAANLEISCPETTLFL